MTKRPAKAKKPPKTSELTTGVVVGTVAPQIPKVPQPHGGALNRGGTPGNAGGRPPNEFKAKLREFVSREDVMGHVNLILTQGPKHPDYRWAAEYATDHGYGKAVQKVEADVQVAIHVHLPQPRSEG